MAEYIDAKYLFKCNTCTHCRNGRCNTYCDHFECYTPDLNLIHAADVVEVRHGYYEKYDDSEFCYCSECGNPSATDDNVSWHGYCPVCNAKMDGKDGAE
jgi:hypothetical protein